LSGIYLIIYAIAWILKKTKLRMELAWFYIIASFSIAIKRFIAYSNINSIFKFIPRNRVKNSRKEFKVFIIGWYGLETSGDEAILYGIMKAFMEVLKKVHFTIYSSDPRWTNTVIQALKSFYKINVVGAGLGFWKALLKSDLVIVGGGPILEDPIMLSWAKSIIFAKLLRKRIAIYGCSIGIAHSKAVKLAIRSMMELSDLILVRDLESGLRIKQFGIQKNVAIIADPSILIKLDIEKKSPCLMAKEISKDLRVGICLRKLTPLAMKAKKPSLELTKLSNDFAQTISSLIDCLIESKNAEVFLIPFQTHPYDDDREALIDVFHKVKHENKKRVRLLLKRLNAWELLSVIGKMDFLIGMRLHSIIFASIMKVPALGIELENKRGKIAAFLKQIDQGSFVISFNDLSINKLLSLMENLMLERSLIEKKLEWKLIDLAQRVLSGMKLICSLL
jgi:polysaccharide pyruvyl transferase WcaK-like protein